MYHSWCEQRGIKVFAITKYEVERLRLGSLLKQEKISQKEYAVEMDFLFKKYVPSHNPELYIAKEQDGIITVGTMEFVNQVHVKADKSVVPIATQIGLLLEAIYIKENKTE